jgi:haloalkane dehalogenase
MCEDRRMDTTRTPDARFADLPGFPYEPRYSDVDGLRLARVDDGDGHPVVLVHGEPTWGYLWRTVLPPLLEAGARVVVPDQVGFGRSDKPTDRSWFTYDRLVASFAGHMEACALEEPVTLVVHDWGGPVGLRWAVEHPEQVARLVILDTGLYARGTRMPAIWQTFRDHCEVATSLPIGLLVQGGTLTELSDEVVGAYEAPFHDDEAQAGALALPLLVPTHDDHPSAETMIAVAERLRSWEQPTTVIWGEQDEILPLAVGEHLARAIPGATDPVIGVRGSHFLQEDAGPEIGARIAELLQPA